MDFDINVLKFNSYKFTLKVIPTIMYLCIVIVVALTHLYSLELGMVFYNFILKVVILGVKNERTMT